jgi:hypothetical protein
VKTGDREKAASDLKRALELEPAYRERALSDEELKSLLP